MQAASTVKYDTDMYDMFFAEQGKTLITPQAETVNVFNATHGQGNRLEPNIGGGGHSHTP